MEQKRTPLLVGEEPQDGQTRLWLKCRTHGMVGITVNVENDEDFNKTYHCPECDTVLEGWE